MKKNSERNMKKKTKINKADVTEVHVVIMFARVGTYNDSYIKVFKEKDNAISCFNSIVHNIKADILKQNGWEIDEEDEDIFVASDPEHPFRENCIVNVKPCILY